MDLYKFAYALIVQHYRGAAATRPIDKRIEKAKLDGMFKAANRLGLGPTEFAIEISLLDAVRAAGERPGFRAVGNEAQKTFDINLAEALAALLSAL